MWYSIYLYSFIWILWIIAYIYIFYILYTYYIVYHSFCVSFCFVFATLFVCDLILLFSLFSFFFLFFFLIFSWMKYIIFFFSVAEISECLVRWGLSRTMLFENNDIRMCRLQTFRILNSLSIEVFCEFKLYLLIRKSRLTFATFHRFSEKIEGIERNGIEMVLIY